MEPQRPRWERFALPLLPLLAMALLLCLQHSRFLAHVPAKPAPAASQAHLAAPALPAAAYLPCSSQPSEALRYHSGKQNGKKFKMANQVVAGGPPVSITFTISSSTRIQNGIQDQSGAQKAAININGAAATSAQPASGTSNGWTLTANSDLTTGTIQAPASAAGLVQCTAQVGEGSNYGDYTFDVVAAPAPSAPRNLTAVLVY